MGLRTAKHEDWIELDNHYPRYHADKARRIAERSDKCCHTHPDAYPAALELLEAAVVAQTAELVADGEAQAAALRAG